MLFPLEVINQLKAQGKRVDYLMEVYEARQVKPSQEIDLFDESAQYDSTNQITLSNKEVAQLQIFGRVLDSFKGQPQHLIDLYRREVYSDVI